MNFLELYIMRVNPTLGYDLRKKEALQKKIDLATHKIAIGFVFIIMMFFFLKMLLPSNPND